jgi:hypothetical protein
MVVQKPFVVVGVVLLLDFHNQPIFAVFRKNIEARSHRTNRFVEVLLKINLRNFHFHPNHILDECGQNFAVAKHLFKGGVEM